MSSFIVEGGRKLSGSITPQGAKNEALEVICATLLTAEPVVISNVPDILDIRNLISLLVRLGVKVDRLDEHTYKFQADEVNIEYLKSEEFKGSAQKLRGSVMIIGPLLARYGYALLPKPGGDKIGRRRLDTHFLGLQKLGAEFKYVSDQKYYEIKASNSLNGTYILLDEASVTGTANLIMAAVLANG
jgi:UDP-N-acetylglucosamine 1-carboxyvinyltransferase